MRGQEKSRSSWRSTTTEAAGAENGGRYAPGARVTSHLCATGPAMLAALPTDLLAEEAARDEQTSTAEEELGVHPQR